MSSDLKQKLNYELFFRLTANEIAQFSVARVSFSLHILSVLEEIGEVLEKVTEDALVILKEVQTFTRY